MSTELVFMELNLDAEQLADDLNTNTTPDFRIKLVKEMFRHDPDLKSEILENA